MKDLASALKAYLDNQPKPETEDIPPDLAEEALAEIIAALGVTNSWIKATYSRLGISDTELVDVLVVMQAFSHLAMSVSDDVEKLEARVKELLRERTKRFKK